MLDTAVFDEYGSLPGHLVNPAKQVMKFTGYFLDVQTQRFNWSAYKDSIDNRPDTDMVIEQYEDNSIAQQDVSLEVMVDKVGDVLRRVGGVEFDKHAMTEKITDSFTGLQEKEDSGFAHYDKQGGGTAFTYRVMFAVPNPHIPSDFYALVSTVKLMATDINSKEAWFGLDKNSRQNFSAEVDAMKLVCNEDFIAGPRP
ncbi:hypothetical protein BN14_08774 [Rhizoctonia solani AG-1 IB]|uniref:Uncharacterized protein n=1 Tax=Thanatephorus cucumeris (strain AG1-IB / isolate 7/3/14) TaxID=1108050 RepID=M5C5V3_THACB|nr:hypothetical protein BN14_08774 [Rhizoctonia solani AG-1 IB]